MQDLLAQKVSGEKTRKMAQTSAPGGRLLKFNLKNRPKRRDEDRQGRWGEITDNPQSTIIKYEVWFEGFEKELREKLRYYKEECVFQVSKDLNAEAETVIEEILGGEGDC